MIKKNRIIIAVLFIAILFSILLFFFYKDENINVLKKYDAETKETTTLEFIIKGKDTIFHGKFINYNEKGNKIYEGNFVNGHIAGKSFSYFDNGIIESTHYRKNINVIQESTYNYTNGKVMKYLMYDDLGMLDFFINYDELGNVKKYQGLPVIEIYQYKIARKEKFKTKNDQYLKIGDTLKYQYLIANIPNSKRNSKIENLNNAKAKRTFRRMSQTGIEVKELLTKKGINTIRAVVKYEFNDNKKTVINDTISFKVNVN